MSGVSKVLFVTKSDFGLRVGGVQIQIEATRRVLAEQGVQVALYNPWIDSLDGVDICHIFTLAPDLYSFASAARHRSIPVVVSPIFNFPSPAWQMRLKSKFLSRMPGVYTDLRQARRMLELAAAVLPLSAVELQRLGSIYDVPRGKMEVVPNGVDQRFFAASPALFVEKFGFKPDVLFVGRLDNNKNVLGLLSALKGSGLKTAVIGSAFSEEPQVFQELLRQTGPEVTYVGGVTHADPILASAYAAAKVFCLPSFKEVMPLTALEAAMAGARVVVTRNSGTRDVLGDDAWYVNPADNGEILAKIQAALAAGSNQPLRQRLLDGYSWEKIGARIVNIYQRL